MAAASAPRSAGGSLTGISFLTTAGSSPSGDTIESDQSAQKETSGNVKLSAFERLISTRAPILESILLQSPTNSILNLYHTSRFLRSFLAAYPTAWQHLSFRLPLTAGSPSRPGVDIGQQHPRASRPYAADQLLVHLAVPYGTCLRSLDLDNTAVYGQTLTSTVLSSRRDTLEHLSVRGCKNVSLKYHIVPYLTMFALQCDPDLNGKATSLPKQQLALKSLYTYRCRHHRRRPYLSSSLQRRDSDSEPTHQLVELCHKLGIWTDTAWCTTPAGRCFRRQGYVSMRVSNGTPEVWVVFDRLWRSKNWIGSGSEGHESSDRDGRLWEHDETGYCGEALGTGIGEQRGEGKSVPVHLRKSHRRFVENIKCDSCLEEISERCEQCSVLMHCVGCRKTFCHSCAFDIPYPRMRPPSGERFWWAPNAPISPCSMHEPHQDNGNPVNGIASATPPRLKFNWCCTEPMFTGGGGISIPYPLTAREVDRVRAVPLPKGQGWEDPEFVNGYDRGFSLDNHVDLMRWILSPSTQPASPCPRNLCEQCYISTQWRKNCKKCEKPLCVEHDLRGLRVRICGYRDLAVEKSDLENSTRLAEAHDSSISQANISSQNRRMPLPLERVASPSPSNVTNTSEVPTPVQTAAFVSEPGEMVQTSTTNSRNHSRSSSRASFYEPAKDTPRWSGCHSFFCPQYRVVGDQRERCANMMQECVSCNITVCQDCVNSHPNCNCTYCEDNYLCPNCYPLKVQDGTCRRASEDKVKGKEQQPTALDSQFQPQSGDPAIFERAIERNFMNDIAMYAGQFFTQVSLHSIPIHIPPNEHGDDGEEESSLGAGPGHYHSHGDYDHGGPSYIGLSNNNGNDHVGYHHVHFNHHLGDPGLGGHANPGHNHSGNGGVEAMAEVPPPNTMNETIDGLSNLHLDPDEDDNDLEQDLEQPDEGADHDLIPDLNQGPVYIYDGNNHDPNEHEHIDSASEQD